MKTMKTFKEFITESRKLPGIKPDSHPVMSKKDAHDEQTKWYALLDKRYDDVKFKNVGNERHALVDGEVVGVWYNDEPLSHYVNKPKK